jgi:hypothetical protein
MEEYHQLMKQFLSSISPDRVTNPFQKSKAQSEKPEPKNPYNKDLSPCSSLINKIV